MNKVDTNKISALLITFNEIDNIPQVINTISFVDEIIVIDSFSTDGTLELLSKQKNVKVITRKFKNFADQRNFAISQASFHWLLFIDADERITPKLRQEILKTVNSNTSVAGYMVNRLHYFNKKRIYFSGYQSDTTYRLFKNGKVKYNENKLVHEMPIIFGQSGILKGKMEHYSFTTYDRLKKKMQTYGHLKARELYSKNKKGSTLYAIVKSTYKFLYNYIFRLGILDGKEGFVICYLNAYGVFYRYKVLKRLHLSTS
jgi:glycosyltransferase involved in cell wall biosynthesis